MIIIHVLAALAALSLSTYNYFSPKNNTLKTSYVLAGGTLASGISLIFVNNASVLRTCVTGLVFFAAVTVLNELARKKLASQSIQHRS